MLDRKNAERAHMEDTVNGALTKADVQAILARRSLTQQDVQALYERFEISSLPPRQRETAVRNAKLLDYFFENSTAEEVGGKYVRKINDRDVVITLTLWAKHNPGGDAML